jgi:hypothetical protein
VRDSEGGREGIGIIFLLAGFAFMKAELAISGEWGSAKI